MRPWVQLAIWLEASNSAVSRFSGIPLLRATGAIVLFAAWQLASKRGDFYNLLWMLVFGFATLNIWRWLRVVWTLPDGNGEWRLGRSWRCWSS
jgi:hypothetical protein